MRIKSLTLILIAILTFTGSIFSQNTITVPDTSIPRGNIINLEVRGTLDINSGDELTLKFTFNSNIIDIKEVVGADDYAVKSVNPEDVTFNFFDLNNASLEFSTTDVQPVTNGVICALRVEGLVYRDSIAGLKPEEVLINGEPAADVNLVPGTITVPGLPVFPGLGEDLGKNYPNPFSWKTVFPFTIKDSTRVHFSAFSTAGRNIHFHEINFEKSAVRKLAADGSYTYMDDPFGILAPGNYELVFTPYTWELSSGSYYMLMVTDYGVYTASFVYLKN